MPIETRQTTSAFKSHTNETAYKYTTRSFSPEDNKQRKREQEKESNLSTYSTSKVLGVNKGKTTDAVVMFQKEKKSNVAHYQRTSKSKNLSQPKDFHNKSVSFLTTSDMTTKDNTISEQLAGDSLSTTTLSEKFQDTIYPSSYKDGDNRVKRMALCKAKRIRFYQNGNEYFQGVVIPVSVARYQLLESLMTDITESLRKKVHLESRVGAIYTKTGMKVSTIEEIMDESEFVCSPRGQQFKIANYGNMNLVKPKESTASKFSMSNNCALAQINPVVIPRFIIVVRNGPKPRKVFKMFLNQRNASNMEQLLKSLTEMARLDSGAARKIHTLSGQQVESLTQIFSEDFEDIFVVSGNDRCTPDTFKLSPSEMKTIQSYLKRYREH